jgi:hypothetical protein
MALQTVNENDGGGATAMRPLSRRLRDYADDQADPIRRHDLRMASELIVHLDAQAGLGAI